MKRLRHTLWRLVVMVGLGCLLPQPSLALAAANIRHAVPSGGLTSGTCLNADWSTACTLQYAITVARAGDQVWAKVGTYTPAASDREVSFALKDGVAIYGGFVGDETSLEQRHLSGTESILSGDLAGDDSGAARWDNPSFAENSYHVVTASDVSASAVLDGFTIRGGCAAGGGFGDEATTGGGISLYESSPLLQNLKISSNASGNLSNGGGMMLAHNSSPWLSNVLLVGNHADQQGGAMQIQGDSSPVLTNVTIVGNHAETSGGAFSVFYATLQVRNSIIWGNTADQQDVISGRLGDLPHFRNSDVQGGCPTSITCEALLQVDPQFVNASGPDGVYGTSDDNLRLQSTSPVINQGSNDVLDPPLLLTDLASQARIFQSIVDMGAYEAHVNLPPESTNQVFHSGRDQLFHGQLAASDVNGDRLSFALSGALPSGTLDLHANGSFDYLPPQGFTGNVAFQFVVSDPLIGPVGPYTARIDVRSIVYLPYTRR